MKPSVPTTLAFAAALTIGLAVSGTAGAVPDVGGAWMIHGTMMKFAFELTCKFDQQGEGLGGICYDAHTNKPHRLTAGHVSGSKVEWTFQSSYLLKTFNVAFSGVADGGAIKGVIALPGGHHGDFAASRQ